MDEQELNLMSSTHSNNPLFGHSTPVYLTHQNNLDSEINQSGSEVAHLGLYIDNSRFRVNYLGRFTHSPALGSGGAYYATTDMDPSTISAFTVRKKSPLSDHNQINVLFKLSGQLTDKKTVSCIN